MVKIGFVSWEYFGWGGSFGGFGSLTRTLAENMVTQGHEVHAFAPMRKDGGMKWNGEINGVQLHTFDSRMKIRFGLKMKHPPDMPDLDIVHTEEPGPWNKTFMEQMPDAVHLVTSQDPRTLDELKTAYFPYYPHMRTLRWRLKFKLKERLCGQFCRDADGVYVQAKYIADKVRRFYNLDYTPDFLPNPISMPKGKIVKADEPTVLFLGRWDPIKRPDLLIKIAKEMPDVQFIACGVSNTQFASYGDPLIKEAKTLPNVNYMGYVRDEVKDTVLRKSWILLNASTRECLPMSFLDAGAYKMAIVSANNPDMFASSFGVKVEKGDFALNYVNALRHLIKSGVWEKKGLEARRYVEETHELERVVDAHLLEYKSHIGD